MTHRRPDAGEMAAPVLEFDLAGELEQLRGEPEWSSGQNAKTLVKHDDLRVVLIALRARARIPDHRTDGRISIHTVRGHLRVRVQDQVRDLPVGIFTLLTPDCRPPDQRTRVSAVACISSRLVDGPSTIVGTELRSAR